MTFLLCCITGKDDMYKSDKSANDDKNTKNTKNTNHITKTKSVSKTDELIIISDFEKCQYWFTEILRQSIKYDEYGKNKKELFEHIWINIDLNKILKYYRRYNNKYSNVKSENIIKFVKSKENEDFIQDICINENIYRFH